MKLLFSLFAFLLCHPITAEIQSVQIKWTTAFCNVSCMQNLAKYLSQMPGVAGVDMNMQIGQASLQWQPTVPFSYINLNNAVARTGAFMDHIQLKVRGTIQARGNTLYLVSIGDNTPFILLGPLQLVPGRYTDPYLLQSYPLTPYLIAQLTQGIQNNLVAVVEGPLYFWQGTTTIYLIIEKLSFELHQ